MNAEPPAGAFGRLDIAIRRKAYAGASGGTREALGRLELSLAVGAVGAVVGPSGCGKTSLLRIVAGLDANFEGAVRLPEAARLAVVFQEPRLLPWRTLEQNIRVAAPDIGAGELEWLLSALGLEGHAKHFPGELSLGLARRAAIARAMAVKPDLLLLDEPFASLDAATAERLAGEFAALVEARAVTTLLVSHDVAMAARLADSIFVLSGAPARLLGRIDVETPRGAMTPEGLAGVVAAVARAGLG